MGIFRPMSLFPVTDAQPKSSQLSSEKSGIYRGRHYSEYAETAERLLDRNEYARAEELLLALCAATEAEAKANQWGVAPAYFNLLSIVYAKQGDRRKELEALERLLRAPYTEHHPNFVKQVNVLRARLHDEGEKPLLVNWKTMKVHLPGCRYVDDSCEAASVKLVQVATPTPCKVCKAASALESFGVDNDK